MDSVNVKNVTIKTRFIAHVLKRSHEKAAIFTELI